MVMFRDAIVLLNKLYFFAVLLEEYSDDFKLLIILDNCRQNIEKLVN